jgi:hypothetical protein
MTGYLRVLAGSISHPELFVLLLPCYNVGENGVFFTYPANLRA